MVEAPAAARMAAAAANDYESTCAKPPRFAVPQLGFSLSARRAARWASKTWANASQASATHDAIRSNISSTTCTYIDIRALYDDDDDDDGDNNNDDGGNGDADDGDDDDDSNKQHNDSYNDNEQLCRRPHNNNDNST